MNSTIERRGTVIAWDQPSGMATVRLENLSACGGCASRGSCGSAGKAPTVMTLPIAAMASPGDLVTVTLPATSLVPAALLGYLLPPAALLAGAVAGELGWGGDLAAVVGAVLGLFGGLAAARLAARWLIGNDLHPELHALAACSAAPASPHHPSSPSGE